MARANRRKKIKGDKKKAAPKKKAVKQSTPRKTRGEAKGPKASFLLDSRHSEIFGVLFVLAAAIVLLSLASFSVDDPVFSGAGEASTNLIGLVGAYLAQGLLLSMGVTAFLLVAGLIYASAVAFTRGALKVTARRLIGYLALAIQGTALCHILLSGEHLLGHAPGGLLGEYAGGLFVSLLSATGSTIALVAGICMALIAVTGFSIVSCARLLARGFKSAGRATKQALVFVGKHAASGLVAAGRTSGSWLAEQGRDFMDTLRQKHPAELAAEEACTLVEPDLDHSATAALRAQIQIGSTANSAQEANLDQPGSSDAFLKPPVSMPPHMGRREPLVVTTDPPHVEGPTVMDGAPAGSKNSIAPAPEKKTKGKPAKSGSAKKKSSASAERLSEPEDQAPKAQPEIVIPRPEDKEVPNEFGKIVRDDDPKQAPVVDYKDYKLPSLDYLDVEEVQETEIDKDRLHEYARRLEKKLSDYGVKGQVTKIMPGPVVTMYEYAPGPGIKVARIAGLSQDLALALEAMSVRIIAPIPGRAVVGIEVSNKLRQMVYSKEIIGHKSFSKQRSKLTMALGKDIEGAPFVADLNKMPHLLVAGATGTGKSVALNCIITSILYKATPEDVRFIMIDPKVLELSLYEGIPHLLLPVVTDPRKAQAALQWAVNEMERRIQILHGAGVRNLDSFNVKAAKQAAANPAPEKKSSSEEVAPGLRKKKKITVIDKTALNVQEELLEVEVDDVDESEEAEAEARLEKMPHIVIVIDELADLMMTSGREVETNIARIAQKARAAGIHLIVATQRPSVNVITGLIKANLPARVSFRVASKVDSRTILDANGAENLLGNGDMLFSPPTSSQLVRVHGAFISEDEISQVVDHLKNQADPVYDESILAAADQEDEDGAVLDDEPQDELYDMAVKIVAEMGQASTSMVQRKLRIGYNRAARLIEQMERDGIVGPPDGSRPRKVLIQDQGGA